MSEFSAIFEGYAGSRVPEGCDTKPLGEVILGPKYAHTPNLREIGEIDLPNCLNFLRHALLTSAQGYKGKCQVHRDNHTQTAPSF